MKWVWCYRLSLKALPVDLRLKHGDAMEALFVQELASARQQGQLHVAVRALGGLADAVRRGIYERVRCHAGRVRVRITWEGRWGMDRVGQDLSQGLRALARAPGFATVVVLTLALGIGANTAIFSVINAVLLKPVPFADPGRVVNLAWEGSGHLQSGLSAAKFTYWEQRAQSLGAVATWQHSVADVDGDAVRLLRVTADFFEVVAYPPILGRSFVAGEYAPQGSGAVMISHGTWRTRFGGDPDVVGRPFRMDGELLEVVGVLPESFAFPYESEAVDAIMPLGIPTVDPNDVAENWPTIARLADGRTLEQARAEVTSLTSAFRAEYPNQDDGGGQGMVLARFSELYVGQGVRHALWLLLGGVGLVLLIACANAANLFLVRASGRRREIAVRAALGASPGRITRLVFTETLVVALSAGVIGLLFAKWTVDLLIGLSPEEIPRLSDVGIDWRVLSFAFGTALATGLVFGSPAVWRVVQSNLSETLKGGARGNSSSMGGRQGLLAAQAGLSMLLLTGAGLLAGTLLNLTRVDPGWEPHGTFVVRLPAGAHEDYQSPQHVGDFQRRVLERTTASPHVVSIAGASNLPLERGVNVPVTVVGQIDNSSTVEWRAITTSYFQTLGIDLVNGRGFNDGDVAQTVPVAVVNETFAQFFFPNQSPLGRRIDIGSRRGESIDPSMAGSEVEIVGVVADVRDISLRNEARRAIYVPQAQASTRLSSLFGTMPVFLVRSDSGLRDVQAVMTEALASIDPALPRPEVVAFEDIMAASLGRERFGAALLSALAALALALTAFGIYGVLAHLVRERRREIGIRMALGADARQVSRMVVLQGTGPVLVGLLVGAGASVALSGLIRPFLWGVTPTDPWTLAVVSAVLLGVAFTASWVPTREALTIDPTKTLTTE